MDGVPVHLYQHLTWVWVSLLFSVFRMLLWPVLRAGLDAQGFRLHALLSEVPARTLRPQRALWLVPSGSASTVIRSSFAVASHWADPWPLLSSASTRVPGPWGWGFKHAWTRSCDLSRAGECFSSSGSWPLLRMDADSWVPDGSLSPSQVQKVFSRHDSSLPLSWVKRAFDPPTKTEGILLLFFPQN